MTPTRNEPPAAADDAGALDPDLEARLQLAADRERPAPESLDALEQAVVERLMAERGALGWLASRRTTARIAGCAVVLALPAALELLFKRRPDLGVYPIAYLVAQVALVAAAMSLALLVVLRPLHLRDDDARTALALALGLGAPALASLVPAIAGMSSSPVPVHAFWASAGSCFRHGVVLAVPALAILYATDRQHHAVGRRALAAAALAGLGSNLALLVHCANNQAAHQLVGHASLGVFFVLVYAVVVQSRPKRSSLL